MDLKTRLLGLGLEDSIVIRILPLLRPEEAATLYDSSDDEIKAKIPELLERVVNKTDYNELDLTKIGLIQPGGGDTVKTLPLKTIESKINTVPSGIPTILKSDHPSQSSEKTPLTKVLIFIILTAGIIFILSGLKEQNPKDTNEVVKEIDTKQPIIKDKEIDPELLNSTELPSPPDFRGAWMFMPWDNYIPSIICNDGRFEHLDAKFTVQFWIKISKNIPEKVSLFAFFSGQKATESIFINKEGYLCFNPGEGHPNIALMKPLPNSGRHFHIAVTREGNKCSLFVNGKVRQTLLIPFEKNDSPRDFIVLMKSDSTLKGLAIDELMVSDEILFEKDFAPERILTMSKSTVLYMPFEKGEEGLIKCYGNKYYKEHLFSGGKWLNVLNEVQQVINHLEFSEETKDLKSSPSEP